MLGGQSDQNQMGECTEVPSYVSLMHAMELNDGEAMMMLEKPEEDEELEHLPDEWIYSRDNSNEREELSGDQDSFYNQQEKRIHI
jgi:hypothetical protein